MKSILIVLIAMGVMGITCPNLCNGRGSCENGNCLCEVGFTGGDCSERVCDYGNPFVDPNGDIYNDAAIDEDANKLNGPKRIELECSGQGICDRTSGLCKCFGGYEGGNCGRQSCVNNCNGHGKCLPVNMLEINSNKEYEEVKPMKEGAEPVNANGVAPLDTIYQYWDFDRSYACACDKEWEGYDCNNRKCASGYTSSSDCEYPSQSVQTITLAAAIDSSSTANKAYLEYTDGFGRKWYTDLVTLNTVDATSLHATDWESKLRSLPSGVIDLESVTAETNSGPKVFTITFGKHQTGFQPFIEVIGTVALDTGGLFGQAYSAPPGYHGMYMTATGGATWTGSIESRTSSTQATPITCSGNGLCEKTTGLCLCFDGYNGIACSESSALI